MDSILFIQPHPNRSRRWSQIVPGTRPLRCTPGKVLGPLLFLAYINDINNNLTEGTQIRLFADDSLLYRTIRNDEDALTLQRDLNTLQTWETANCMEFHPEKCQILRITKKQTPILANYNIHNVSLSPVDSTWCQHRLLL